MKKYNVKVLAYSLVFSGIALASCNKTDKVAAQAEHDKVEHFIKEAAANDVFELTAGMMAAEQSKAQKVDTYGQQIVQVHSRTNPVLESLAKRKHIELPAELPSEKKKLVAQLEDKKGEEFDKEFATVQLEAHQEAVALYEKADKEVEDKDIQAFVDQVLPVLKEHLVAAQEIHTELIAKNN